MVVCAIYSWYNYDMEKELEVKIINILRQSHVNFAALFGSRAKEKAEENSDFDFLIETDPNENFSLLGHADLQSRLEAALKQKVDLVTLNGLNRFMRDEVLKTMKVVYDERKRRVLS